MQHRSTDETRNSAETMRVSLTIFYHVHDQKMALQWPESDVDMKSFLPSAFECQSEVIKPKSR